MQSICYYCRILTKIEFPQQIFKNPQIRPVGPWFQTDRRTDMTKLTVAFRNFFTSPKNVERYGARFVTPLF